ncbi:MAG: hypothetical protein R3E68_10920 [Burkholderiaceae bacterium]
MELSSSPMTPRQKDYRAVYRQRINGWYNGALHVVMIYTIGALSLWYFIAHLQDVRWWEWLIVPIALLACNLFEWALHTYVMHGPTRFRGRGRSTSGTRCSITSSSPKPKCGLPARTTGGSRSFRPMR